MTKNRQHMSEHGCSVELHECPSAWENSGYKVVHRHQICTYVFLLQAAVAKCEKGSLKISEARMLFT